MTFENVIIPFGRYEYVEGQAIKDVELEWNYIFAGFGLGYRTSLSPGYQDNVFEPTFDELGSFVEQREKIKFSMNIFSLWSKICAERSGAPVCLLFDVLF
jgi:hypothetical protein